MSKKIWKQNKKYQGIVNPWYCNDIAERLELLARESQPAILSKPSIAAHKLFFFILETEEMC